MYMRRPLAFYVYIHDNRYIICAAKTWPLETVQNNKVYHYM